MQFITIDQRIAVEAFSVGNIYQVIFTDNSYFLGACIGIGDNFVMFQRPELLFALTMQSASDVAAINDDMVISRTYSGAPPLSFPSNGQPLLSWTMYGNTTQGTGERTGNLFDKSTMTENAYLQSADGAYQLSSANSYSCLVKVKPNTSYRVRAISKTFRIAFFTHKPLNGSIPTAFYSRDQDAYRAIAAIITSGSEDLYMVVFCYNASIEYTDGKTVDEIMATVMISEGTDISVPFEPYGYKIPIICGGTITTVYIGSNPLRKSLDGTAVDELSSNGTLTQRVDTDGSVLSTPFVSQIDTPAIPTISGINTLSVDTIIQPSSISLTAQQ